jgi:hypothetical protein
VVIDEWLMGRPVLKSPSENTINPASKDAPIRMVTFVHCLKPIPRNIESVKKEERLFAFLCADFFLKMMGFLQALSSPRKVEELSE